MIEMVRRFLRQKFDNPVIAVTLAATALVTAVPVAVSGSPSAGPGFLALVVLAAGSVSKDASSGALQMILARPIRRLDYLYGRYLGILSSFALFLAGAAVLAVLVSLALLPALRVPRESLPLVPLARAFSATFLSGILFSAVLLFFSTFLPGYGDVLGYFLLSLLLSVGGGLGDALKRPWMTGLFRALKENVLPEPDFDAILAGRGPLSEATGRWALAVVGFLVAAALVFGRREFAYGHD